MPATVRWSRRADIAGMAAADAVTPDEVLTFLRTPEGVALTAEGPRGEVAGFLLLRHRPGRLEVARVGVAPEFRRRGVGLKLVAHAAAKLGRDGRDRLEARVPLTNAPARRFFAALGFHGWPAGEDVLFTLWTGDGPPETPT